MNRSVVDDGGETGGEGVAGDAKESARARSWCRTGDFHWTMFYYSFLLRLLNVT